MALISLNSSVNSVVPQRNGSAGVTLIFASLAIKNSVPEITYRSIRKISYQNVKGQENVRLEATMGLMERKKCWDVPYAETTKIIRRISDFTEICPGQTAINFDRHIYVLLNFCE
jgi:hypothetical protein